MKIKVSVQCIFILLLMIMPLIDTFNGMFIRNNDSVMNIGQVYRIIIFILLLLLFKNIKKQLAAILIVLFSVFCFIQVLLPVPYYISNVILCLKLFIPIFMIFVFEGLIKNNKILFQDIIKIFDVISFITPFTIIIPYLFRTGYRTYDGSAGYLGFYFATNEISFVISSCVMYLVTRLDKLAGWKYLFLLVLNISSVLLIGTKSALAVVGACIFLYIFRFIIKKQRGSLKKLFVILAVIIAIIAGFRLFADNLNSVYIRWLYGRQQNPGTSFLFFLTSGRTGRIETAWREFHNGSLTQILFGWGLAGGNYAKPYVEMDYFDLLFSAGWAGLIVILFLYIYCLKSININFWSLIFLSFAFVLIFAGGHVLYAGLGGMMNALLITYLISYSFIKTRTGKTEG